MYAPRSGHFFDRKEVAWFFGCLLFLFSAIRRKLGQSREMDETEGIRGKYALFLSMAEVMMESMGT